MPENIAQPCAPLAEISDTSGKAVLFWASQTIAQYQDCQNRHSAAVATYQSIFNSLKVKENE